MPAVAAFGMNPRMALFAKGHQITAVVRPSLRERELVVNLLGWRVRTFRKADLTQRMLRSIGIPDAFPSPSVSTLGGRVAVVPFVTLGLQLLVFWAEPFVRQVGAAGVGTGPFRSLGHVTSTSVRKIYISYNEGQKSAKFTSPIMKEVYFMDTRFEFNIKKVSIKGDDQYLYLYFNNKLIVKLEYRDIETAANYLIKKAQVQQIPGYDQKLLNEETASSEDK
jgi:hypothetical protein